MDAFPIPANVIAMIRLAAARLALRDEAVLAALTQMSLDLFPAPIPFAAFFTGKSAPAASAPTWRTIGDAFWSSAAASAEQRRLEGSFYTPTRTVDRIIDLVWKDLHGNDNQPRGTVLDPAVGCGYFPLRLAERMKKKHGPEKTRRWAKTSLHAVDKSPAAVFLARALLWLTLSTPKRQFIPPAENIRCGDSLLGPGFENGAPARDLSPDALDWKNAFPEIHKNGGFDAILGNPPYEVLTNFARRPERRKLAQALRQNNQYRDSLSGQINLYRCFIERSLSLLRPGGVLSMVVPLSLARDAAALPLRRRLLEREDAADWLLFGERDNALGNVTQSACVFKARRDAGPARKLAVAALGEKNRIALAELAKSGGGSFAVPMLNRAGLRLWRWLWTRVEGSLADAAALRVGEVDQTFFRDCMRDADTGCLLARGGHLSPFLLDVSPREGRERFLDLPLFLERKGAAAEACRARAETWRVAQLGIRNMETRPRLVAALMPPGVYAGNSLNVYAPVPGVSLDFLAGMLNSRLLDWLFRVGSGNNNINLAEMRPLPFPAGCAAALAEAVADAYRECAALAGTGKSPDPGRPRLDAAVEACYGVPRELLSGVFPDGEEA